MNSMKSDSDTPPPLPSFLRNNNLGRSGQSDSPDPKPSPHRFGWVKWVGVAVIGLIGLQLVFGLARCAKDGGETVVKMGTGPRVKLPPLPSKYVPGPGPTVGFYRATRLGDHQLYWDEQNEMENVKITAEDVCAVVNQGGELYILGIKPSGRMTHEYIPVKEIIHHDSRDSENPRSIHFLGGVKYRQIASDFIWDKEGNGWGKVYYIKFRETIKRRLSEKERHFERGEDFSPIAYYGSKIPSRVWWVPEEKKIMVAHKDGRLRMELVLEKEGNEILTQYKIPGLPKSYSAWPSPRENYQAGRSMSGKSISIFPKWEGQTIFKDIIYVLANDPATSDEIIRQVREKQREKAFNR